MKKKSYRYPLIIIGLLFFVFGFITWVNGILVPYFKICLQLTNLESLLVAFATYISFFIFAIPASMILKVSGYKKGMIIGLFIMAVGAFLFIPAAYSRQYVLFLLGIFITASGMVLLQAAANPYVAKIGPAESTAQRIGFMGLSNKFAGILSQTILGGVLLFNADAIIESLKTASIATQQQILDQYAQRVILPYCLIGVGFLIIAVMIYFSGLPDIKDEQDEKYQDVQDNRKSIFSFPHLVLAVVALFFAGACEVIPVDGIIIYSTSLNVPLAISKNYGSYTLYAMIAGYLATTILIPKVLSQRMALFIAGVAGIVLSLCAYLSHGVTSVYFMMAMGFFTAWLWGTIWGLGIQNLGKFTKIGSGLLLMGVVGGALWPLVFGRLIDLNAGRPQNALLLLIPCYMMVMCYAWYGSKIKTWKRAH